MWSATPSAWDIDEKDDLRIKMCIDVNAEDFKTIHHELGHNYYQRAYKDQSYLYRSSANDGFHEAVGDTLSLSITPEYLAQLGLLDEVPDASGDLGLLMQQALDKIAFLPFGLMVDQWRWKVFAGEVGPDGYNDLWWHCGSSTRAWRRRANGPRTPSIPAPSTTCPATRRTRATSWRTSCSSSSIARCARSRATRARSTAARFTAASRPAQRLNAMLEMGRSRPWPEALEALTGSPEMDATAILDYFRTAAGLAGRAKRQAPMRLVRSCCAR